MKQPSTITEAIEQLEYVYNYYVSRMFPNDKIPKIERGGDLGENEKTDSDMHIRIDGWLIITPFHTEETYRVIGGERIRGAIHFSIQKEVYVRGVHYYSDGSGEPDSTDIVDIESAKDICSVINAIEMIFKLMFENELEVIRENFFEDEMSRSEEEEPYL